MSKLKEIGYARNRRRIEAAYKAYMDKEPYAEDNLLQAVTEFAQKKLEFNLAEVDDSVASAADYMQEIVFYVWTKLTSFKGGPSSFYSWLNRLCYTKGSDAHRIARKSNSARVPLQIPDAEDTGLLDDNPEIYKEEPFRPVRRLPDFIQGTNRLICDYIREGLNYKQIGDALQMTEAAVKKNVQRMKEKVEQLNAEGKTD